MSRSILLTGDIEPDWPYGGFRGLDNLPPLLDLLDEFSVRVSFFWTGKAAFVRPELLKECAERGHEIGCHSHEHVSHASLRLSIEEDIRKATRVIEDIVGSQPRMFRAPNFSAMPGTWTSLYLAGYTIDSSVMPGRIDRRNGVDWRKAERGVHEVGNGRSWSLTEVPLTPNPFDPMRPLGMGWLNARGSKETWRAIEMTGGPYVAFLAHSWEMTVTDGLRRILERVEASEMAFGTIEEAASHAGGKT